MLAQCSIAGRRQVLSLGQGNGNQARPGQAQAAEQIDIKTIIVNAHCFHFFLVLRFELFHIFFSQNPWLDVLQFTNSLDANR